MKTLEIIGTNYFGYYDKTRTACRAVLIKDGMILLVHETNTGTWMIPGGGHKENESDRDCLIRETSEETGFVIDPSDCILEINEYYENCRYISRYFPGNITGSSETNLTEQEQEAGLKPQWISINEALEIFSKHESYRDTDEMKRGLYQREHAALSEIINAHIVE
ncbi:MAG: NUDIX hydrolase [Erysipelotrichaceae bacterium]|nr:NUDIX hydrolase [Erysipelotrichaceae bacterium]